LRFKKNIYLKKEGNLLYGEIERILKTSKEEIILALDINKPVNSIEESIYSDNKSDGSINILETLSTNKDEANLITNKITLHKLINNLIPRDKEIILLRYYKDKTQSDVAKIIGISQVQVSRIEKKILEKMKKELIV
jgi:RNA polymerase sporulation-specific sigma factor